MATSEHITVVVAPDSFKGSLTAVAAAGCIATGLRRAARGWHILKAPMADGGEGTVKALVAATRGREVSRTVRDPLGRPVRAVFGVSGDGKTAIIEMAAASGLCRLAPGERNPLRTSSARLCGPALIS